MIGILLLGAWMQALPLMQAQPLAKWSFEDTAAPDTISGLYRFVPGVSGKALQFDGYTTHIVRRYKEVPPLAAGAFTVECWVALDAYPWNWVPIVDWERDMQAGFLFGIDAYGHIGLHAAVGGWQALTSTARVPLKRWTHIAGAFDPSRGLALFINGQPAGQLAVEGKLMPPEQTDLLIGRVRQKMMPLPSGLIHPKDPVYYALEGALDELTIHGNALSKFDLAKAPEGMSSPWPVMPAGAPGAGTFGAYYETLRFQDTWDRPRRIGPRSDVVVRFEQSPMRLVFWQGNNYVPAWVTENGKWYTDEFMEAYAMPRCPDGEDCEPMSDKQVRYSHVRILESSEARAVVHWRYALSEVRNYKGSFEDPLTGWFDWADEYWTVYPDGVAIRKQVLWSSYLDDVRPDGKVRRAEHEFQESIVLNSPGQWPEDNINFDAITLANMKGETEVYRWQPKPRDDVFEYPHGPDSFSNPPGANIQWVNLKSAWKPFQIVQPPVLFRAYNAEKSISSFMWWNHWPVAQIPSSGRPALAPDRPSHSSLSWIYWASSEATENSITRLLMNGLTTKPAAELAPLAKSWLNPPAIRATGVRVEGYRQAERAYVLVRESAAGSAGITLQATPESPVVNPAFVIRNWSGGTRVLVNGKSSGRIGQSRTLQGTDLVVWIEMHATEPVGIEIQ